MPFKSKAQQRYFFAAANRGEIPMTTAKRWAHETSDIKNLPERTSKSKSKHETKEHKKKAGNAFLNIPTFGPNVLRNANLNIFGPLSSSNATPSAIFGPNIPKNTEKKLGLGPGSGVTGRDGILRHYNVKEGKCIKHAQFEQTGGFPPPVMNSPQTLSQQPLRWRRRSRPYLKRPQQTSQLQPSLVDSLLYSLRQLLRPLFPQQRRRRNRRLKSTQPLQLPSSRERNLATSGIPSVESDTMLQLPSSRERNLVMSKVPSVESDTMLQIPSSRERNLATSGVPSVGSGAIKQRPGDSLQSLPAPQQPGSPPQPASQPQPPQPASQPQPPQPASQPQQPRGVPLPPQLPAEEPVQELEGLEFPTEEQQPGVSLEWFIDTFGPYRGPQEYQAYQRVYGNTLPPGIRHLQALQAQIDATIDAVNRDAGTVEGVRAYNTYKRLKSRYDATKYLYQQEIERQSRYAQRANEIQRAIGMHGKLPEEAQKYLNLLARAETIIASEMHGQKAYQSRLPERFSDEAVRSRIARRIQSEAQKLGVGRELHPEEIQNIIGNVNAFKQWHQDPRRFVLTPEFTPLGVVFRATERKAIGDQEQQWPRRQTAEEFRRFGNV